MPNRILSELTVPQTVNGVVLDTTVPIPVTPTGGGATSPYVAGTLSPNPGVGQRIVTASAIAIVTFQNTSNVASTDIGLFDNNVPNTTNLLFTIHLGPDGFLQLVLNATLQHGGLVASNNTATTQFFCTYTA